MKTDHTDANRNASMPGEHIEIYKTSPGKEISRTSFQETGSQTHKRYDAVSRNGDTVEISDACRQLQSLTTMSVEKLKQLYTGGKISAIHS